MNFVLSDLFNLPAVRYDDEAMIAREPALLPDVAGGWHYECDAHLRPDKLMRSWRAVLERQGVAIRENCEFLSFARSGGLARGVETSQGMFPADAVVVATGAWTPQLARQLQCRVPIQPGKGYSITMPRPAVCPTTPLIFPECKVAVTPMQSAYRLGSTMEFAGYDATIDPRRLQVLRDGAKQYLREPYCEPVEEAWYGWRPMTYDSIPIIGRLPRTENVVLAAGHNMLGLSMAAGTGKLVAEILTGETSHVDPEPYSPARF